MLSNIQTRRRLEYARGYLALDMVRDAADELSQIHQSEQEETDVLEVWIDIYMELKKWKRVVSVSSKVCARRPASERGWIAWAYALRELQKISEAKAVLLQAESLHGATCGVLHYNLACYYCLLGDFDEAHRRLRRACSMDPNWRDAALEDPDLKDMHTSLQSLD